MYKVLFNYSKSVDGLLLVALTGIQNNAWEVGTVWRIGEMLCLQAYC